MNSIAAYEGYKTCREERSYAGVQLPHLATSLTILCFCFRISHEKFMCADSPSNYRSLKNSSIILAVINNNNFLLTLRYGGGGVSPNKKLIYSLSDLKWKGRAILSRTETNYLKHKLFR